ncbi:hypothetical protein BC361_09445 [Ensifer sp. LC54]|nr:hypothetical protein BC361_09445 [Ensifer sp. LC54]OCP28444.1 hypothetical protein BC363_00915 [Ensifer sp. LC384]
MADGELGFLRNDVSTTDRSWGPDLVGGRRPWSSDDQLYFARNTGRNRVCLVEYLRLPGDIKAMANQLREGVAGALTDAFGSGLDDRGEEPSRVAGC